MLRKLLKYDLAASFRYLWMAYAALILVAAMAGVSFLLRDQENASVILLTAAILLMVLLVLAVVVLSIVQIVTYFNSNLLKSEGYLMHTLPVHTWQLVLSKLLSSVIVVCASTAACGLAAVVWVLCSNVAQIYADFWNTISAFAQYFHLNISWGTWALSLVSGIVGAVTLTLNCYAALSLGQLAARHRILMAFVWFVVFRIAGNVLNNLLDVFWAYRELSSAADYLYGSSISQLIVNVVLSVICFVITEGTLNRHLNLE